MAMIWQLGSRRHNKVGKSHLSPLITNIRWATAPRGMFIYQWLRGVFRKRKHLPREQFLVGPERQVVWGGGWAISGEWVTDEWCWRGV